MIDQKQLIYKEDARRAVLRANPSIVYCIDRINPVDAVSRGVLDQIRWERDIAIWQLESYGISLGEKADVKKVRHAHWDWDGKHFYCSGCAGTRYHDLVLGLDAAYCPYCGAQMDERVD